MKHRVAPVCAGIWFLLAWHELGIPEAVFSTIGWVGGYVAATFSEQEEYQ